MASRLAGRRVLLGISGGIAAYKTPELVRALQALGAEVRCLVTEKAARLVSVDVLSALTRHPVASEVFGDGGSVYTRHIEWAQWADLYLIAPATANTLARLAAGLAEDPVSMAWLVVQGPKLLCPSMNPRMLQAPATVRNLSLLRQDGATVLEPDQGELACGETGPGRLPDPAKIAGAVEQILSPPSGKRVLLTMGRTEEPVDDVRILTNRSSGRTGAALAAEALRRGHMVTVVCGPCETTPPAGATVVRVVTALEMAAACAKAWSHHDWAICAAAVADFRPAIKVDGKIPASRGLDSIPLAANPDILQELCKTRQKPQRVVGFALESGELQRGSQKLQAKGADLAVCNDPLRDPAHGGFGSDRTWAWVGPSGQTPQGTWMRKDELATGIFEALEAL